MKTTLVPLSLVDRSLIQHCLQMRRNWIEIGSVVMSWQDMIDSKQPGRIRDLIDSQREVIAEITALLERLASL